jgi:hypothetical protein
LSDSIFSLWKKAIINLKPVFKILSLVDCFGATRIGSKDC